jgi:hypothetical protein
MIHILNNMTSDYDLQLTFMRKRICDKLNPLTIDEIRKAFEFRFEGLIQNQMKTLGTKL